MPSYQMSVIIKAALTRPELKDVVRRTCSTLLDRGGIIRSMENLGLKPLPYKMISHGDRHFKGNYFLINFDSPPNILTDVEDCMRRDVDVIRRNILLKEEDFIRPCVTGPCEFGELKNPDHERRVWRRKVLKNAYAVQRHKMKS